MLNELRQQINHIDRQLLSLLNERFHIVEKIADYKQQQTLPIQDRNRETDVIRQLQQYAKTADYVLDPKDIVQIYNAIITVSRQRQSERLEKKE